MTYKEQLRHPLWQKKRLEIFDRGGFICLHCGRDDKNLQVHHGYYEKGKMAWEYENESLHTLCEDCHEYFEKVKKEIYKEIAMVPVLHQPSIYFNLVSLIIDKTAR